MAIKSVEVVKNEQGVVVTLKSDKRDDLLEESIYQIALDQLRKHNYSGYGIENISPIIPLDKKGKVIQPTKNAVPCMFQRTVQFTPISIF